MSSPTARRVALVAALALLGDLLLVWQSTSVRIAGAVDVEATSRGYAGWGLLAGAGALVLVAVEVGRLRGSTVRPRAGLAAAVVMLIGTALAVFSGSAEIAAPAVGVEVDTTRWPAWVGLGLAAIAVAAELAASRSAQPKAVAR